MKSEDLIDDLLATLAGLPDDVLVQERAAAQQLVAYLEGVEPALVGALALAETTRPSHLFGRRAAVLAWPHGDDSVRDALLSMMTDLEATTRRLFARLGAFADRFTLAQAEVLSGDDAQTLVQLSQLVERAMVEREVNVIDDEYRLPGPWRQLAAELLNELADARLIRGRHARLFAPDSWPEGAVVPPYNDREPSLASDRIAAWRTFVAGRHDELEAAVDCLIASALSPAWGDLDPLEALEEALEHSLDKARVRRTHLRRIEVLARRDRAAAKAALRDVTAVTDAERGVAELVTAALHRADGRSCQAEESYRAALATCASDHGVTLLATAELGGLLCETGRLNEARTTFVDALALARHRSERRLSAIVAGHLGLVAQQLGDLDGAFVSLADALESHRRIGNQRFVAITTLDLGTLALEQGRSRAARRLLAEACDMLSARGDEALARLGTALTAVAAWDEGDDQQAHILFRRATFGKTLPTAIAQSVALAGLVKHARAAATQRLDGGDPTDQLTALTHAVLHIGRLVGDEPRTVLRILKQRRRVAVSTNTVAIGAAGASVTPIGGKATNLERRQQLSRIVEALVAERLDAGGWLDQPTLIEAGWPGETIVEEAATNRLHVAISTLRKLGLRAHLTSDNGTYRLVGPLLLTDPAPSRSES